IRLAIAGYPADLELTPIREHQDPGTGYLDPVTHGATLSETVYQRPGRNNHMRHAVILLNDIADHLANDRWIDMRRLDGGDQSTRNEGRGRQPGGHIFWLRCCRSGRGCWRYRLIEGYERG